LQSLRGFYFWYEYSKLQSIHNADGVMVEVHPEPDKSVSDAKQTIHPETFAEMVISCQRIRSAMQMDQHAHEHKVAA